MTDGQPLTRHFAVPANSRFTVGVGADLPETHPGRQPDLRRDHREPAGRRACAAAAQIVVERAMVLELEHRGLGRRKQPFGDALALRPRRAAPAPVPRSGAGDRGPSPGRACRAARRPAAPTPKPRTSPFGASPGGRDSRTLSDVTSTPRARHPRTPARRRRSRQVADRVQPGQHRTHPQRAAAVAVRVRRAALPSARVGRAHPAQMALVVPLADEVGQHRPVRGAAAAGRGVRRACTIRSRRSGGTTRKPRRSAGNRSC